MQYAYKSIKISANYTFNDSRDENKNIFPEIAKHTANADFTYRFNDKVKLNLRTNYLGERKNWVLISATNSDMIDEAFVFHGGITYFYNKKMGVHLYAKNIFNKTYYHTSNRRPDRYRQPQQAILLKLTYDFNEIYK
jgi:outer membrane receptor for ferrienterochelin and colicin